MRLPLTKLSDVRAAMQAMHLGTQPIDECEVEWAPKQGETFGVRIASGQRIEGQHAATRIKWMGGPGTAAFEWHGHNNNPEVFWAAIENMQIECPNGGDAVRNATDTPTKCDSCEIKGVRIIKGGVWMPGEHYRCEISADFNNPLRTALRIDGQGNTIPRIVVRGTVTNRKTRGAIEIHGSAEFSKFGWAQGTGTINEFGVPFFYFADWIQPDNGYVHPGVVGFAGLAYDEAHHKGVGGVVENSVLHMVHTGATARAPWQLNRSARMYLQVEPNAGAIKADSTSKLFMRGKDVTPDVQ